MHLWENQPPKIILLEPNEPEQVEAPALSLIALTLTTPE